MRSGSPGGNARNVYPSGCRLAPSRRAPAPPAPNRRGAREMRGRASRRPRRASRATGHATATERATARATAKMDASRAANDHRPRPSAASPPRRTRPSEPRGAVVSAGDISIQTRGSRRAARGAGRRADVDPRWDPLAAATRSEARSRRRRTSRGRDTRWRAAARVVVTRSRVDEKGIPTRRVSFLQTPFRESESVGGGARATEEEGARWPTTPRRRSSTPSINPGRWPRTCASGR